MSRESVLVVTTGDLMCNWHILTLPLNASGSVAEIVFPLCPCNKTRALEKMSQMTGQDLAAYVRRSSNSLARGKSKSKFRGVVRNEVTGKWLARKGTRKDCFLGLYDTEEGAAIAFDVQCIKEKGYRAITNYSLRCYDVESIIKSQLAFLQQQQAKLDLQTIRRCQQQQQSPGKPAAFHLNVVPKSVVTKVDRKQYMVWTLAAARRELAAKASTSRFEHGVLSPFSPYHQVLQSKEEQGHNDGRHDRSSYATRVVPYRWFGPYQTSSATEASLRAQGLGFRHESSSCFEAYDSNNQNKGKERVIDI
ncbi:uncharacterized protein LOC126676362 isoform X1 [Mercurialis annua]|uniref:uncharacterized protein LOC126676362 isoform X1 n=3 Tax=Mercurialis annua TaxID=3986 RepID=UPI00215E47A0|nr:uncharacterized protein LOC126676362 isoform X1 [Mercurialis annua]